MNSELHCHGVFLCLKILGCESVLSIQTLYPQDVMQLSVFFTGKDGGRGHWTYDNKVK